MFDKLWKWKLLSKQEQFDFAGHILWEYVNQFSAEKKSIVYLFQLFLCLEFCKKNNLICNFLHFETLQPTFENIRWKLKDDENIEVICFLYDFAPKEVQCYIDQIRIDVKEINQTNIIHIIKCSDKPKDYFLSLIKWKPEDEFTHDYFLSHLIYHEHALKWYNSKQIIQSYALYKMTASSVYYNIYYMPTYPNDLFLKEFYESIEILLAKENHQHILKSHILNLLDYCIVDVKSKYFIGICAKSLRYGLVEEKLVKKYLKEEDINDYCMKFLMKQNPTEQEWNQLSQWVQQQDNIASIRTCFYLSKLNN